ncbi:DUF3027 domain-containing protein [Naumannella halotolerans]|uniref:DUF3027 family protein n=1 Tax=Naumannella halotolerans TaxID=993414 RepID=A0A4V3EN59_9ACTN|nr:Protein of unknown function (DUF3027) [Naumannella halotolerans]
MPQVTERKRPKLDAQLAAAIDDARRAAEESADVFEVGEHLGVVPEAERVVTHWFACHHPGYPGWRWAVTLTRASRARTVTVNEVALLPGTEALGAPEWLPWDERIQPGDVGPGMLLATPDNDPRLEPGYTAGSIEVDPEERVALRSVVSELGLGRERVLTAHGRDLAAQRWLHAAPGPHNDLTRQAPDVCGSCGYLVRLQGGLGVMFGACANEYSPSDGRVVSIDHGCGAHSSVTEPERGVEIPEPVWDTISVGESIFD